MGCFIVPITTLLAGFVSVGLFIAFPNEASQIFGIAMAISAVTFVFGFFGYITSSSYKDKVEYEEVMWLGASVFVVALASFIAIGILAVLFLAAMLIGAASGFFR